MTATAPARAPLLTEAEAIRILNSMSMMVAASNSRLTPGSIFTVPYEVSDMCRAFTFPPQPFQIMREITFQEFVRAMPPGTRAGPSQRRFFYVISTD